MAHVRRYWGTFSPRMRRNGNLGAPGQTCDLTVRSSDVDDVSGIYLLFLCTNFIWPCDLSLWPLDLDGVSHSLSSFIYPMNIPILRILRLSLPELWMTQSCHISITWNGHHACTMLRDLSLTARQKNIHVFQIRDSNLCVHYTIFMGLRRRYIYYYITI